MSQTIKRDQKIPIPLRRGQHQLLLQHALLDGHPSKPAVLAAQKRSVDLTLTELADLLGCILTAANRCHDPDLEYGLDALYDRLDAIRYSYEEMDAPP